MTRRERSALTADPFRGHSVGRGLGLGAALVASAAWVASLLTVITRPQVLPGWFSTAALACLAVALAWAVVRWRAQPSLGLRIYVLGSLLIWCIEDAVYRRIPGDVDYPPLSFVLTTAMVLSGVAFTPVPATILVCLFVIVFSVQRLPVVGIEQGLPEAALYLGSGLILVVVVAALGRELDRVAAATARTQRLRARADAAIERNRTAARWDGLVHDKVLSALSLAARGRVVDAAVLAAEAVLWFDGGGRAAGASEGPIARIQRHAHALGVRLSIDVSSWPDGLAGEASETAVCEAISNVARHAGVRDAALTAVWRDGMHVITLSDHGRGFDAGSVSERRLGVRQRIIGAVGAVGGTARVESRAEAGTRVVVTMAADSGVEPHVVPESWTPQAFASVAGVCALIIGGEVAIGALHLGGLMIPGLAVVGMTLIPLLTVLIATLPPRSGGWMASIVGVVMLWGLLLGSLRHPATSDWSLWFVGAFNTALVVVALRRSWRISLLVIASATALGTIVLLARGEHAFLAPVAEATFQTLGWSIAGGWFKGVLDRANATIAAQEALGADAERSALVEAGRDEELQRRKRALGSDVVPMLCRIAAEELLSDADRRQASLLESAARDELVAAPLLTDPLRTAIRRARGRGVSVVVVGQGGTGVAGASFEGVAMMLLDAARPRDRVQLTWRGAQLRRLGSASLVGAGVGTAWSAEAPAAAGDLRVVFTFDDDSVLAEFIEADSDQDG